MANHLAHPTRAHSENGDTSGGASVIHLLIRIQIKVKCNYTVFDCMTSMDLRSSPTSLEDQRLPRLDDILEKSVGRQS